MLNGPGPPAAPSHLQPLCSTVSAGGIVPNLELDCLAHGAQMDGQVGRIGNQVACNRGVGSERPIGNRPTGSLRS